MQQHIRYHFPNLTQNKEILQNYARLNFDKSYRIISLHDSCKNLSISFKIIFK